MESTNIEESLYSENNNLENKHQQQKHPQQFDHQGFLSALLSPPPSSTSPSYSSSGYIPLQQSHPQQLASIPEVFVVNSLGGVGGDNFYGGGGQQHESSIMGTPNPPPILVNDITSSSTPGLEQLRTSSNDNPYNYDYSVSSMNNNIQHYSIINNGSGGTPIHNFIPSDNSNVAAVSEALRRASLASNMSAGGGGGTATTPILNFQNLSLSNLQSGAGVVGGGGGGIGSNENSPRISLSNNGPYSPGGGALLGGGIQQQQQQQLSPYSTPLNPHIPPPVSPYIVYLQTPQLLGIASPDFLTSPAPGSEYFDVNYESYEGIQDFLQVDDGSGGASGGYQYQSYQQQPNHQQHLSVTAPGYNNLSRGGGGDISVSASPVSGYNNTSSNNNNDGGLGQTFGISGLGSYSGGGQEDQLQSPTFDSNLMMNQFGIPTATAPTIHPTTSDDAIYHTVDIIDSSYQQSQQQQQNYVYHPMPIPPAIHTSSGYYLDPNTSPHSASTHHNHHPASSSSSSRNDRVAKSEKLGKEARRSKSPMTLPLGGGGGGGDDSMPPPIKIKLPNGPDGKPKPILYQCNFKGGCDKTYTRPYNLKSHYLAEHTDMRPHQCSFCQKTFVRKHDLQRHEKLHQDDRPHNCNVCNKSFARTDALKRHRSATEPGKETACTDPSLPYMSKSNLESLERDLMNEAMGDGGGGGGGGDDDAEWGI